MTGPNGLSLALLRLAKRVLAPSWLLWSAAVFMPLFFVGGLATRGPISTSGEFVASRLVADYETWPGTTYQRVGSGFLVDLELSYGPIAAPAQSRECLTDSGCMTISEETDPAASSTSPAEPDGSNAPNCPPPSQGRPCREP